MSNPLTTRVIVVAYPKPTINATAMFWLMRHKIPPGHITFISMRPEELALNRAVQEFCLPPQNIGGTRVQFDDFLILENDIEPTHQADRLWASEADVAAVQYPVKNMSSYADPTMFHSGMMLIRRKVFEGIQPPWFMPVWNEQGTGTKQCLCGYFHAKVQKAGFTIERCGWADHKVKE